MWYLPPGPRGWQILRTWVQGWAISLAVWFGIKIWIPRKSEDFCTYRVDINEYKKDYTTWVNFLIKWMIYFFLQVDWWQVSRIFMSDAKNEYRWINMFLSWTQGYIQLTTLRPLQETRFQVWQNTKAFGKLYKTQKHRYENQSVL